MVRDAAAVAGRAVAVLQDLQGPKIRTGLLAGGGPVQLVAGATFSITTEEVIGDAGRVSTTYEALPRDIRPGDRILLSDGAISLRAIRTSETEVLTEVVYGGSLSERQGINLPGIDLSIRGVTEKDLADLRFGFATGSRHRCDLVRANRRRGAAGQTADRGGWSRYTGDREAREARSDRCARRDHRSRRWRDGGARRSRRGGWRRRRSRWRRSGSSRRRTGAQSRSSPRPRCSNRWSAVRGRHAPKPAMSPMRSSMAATR